MSSISLYNICVECKQNAYHRLHFEANEKHYMKYALLKANA